MIVPAFGLPAKGEIASGSSETFSKSDPLAHAVKATHARTMIRKRLNNLTSRDSLMSTGEIVNLIAGYSNLAKVDRQLRWRTLARFDTPTLPDLDLGQNNTVRSIC